MNIINLTPHEINIYKDGGEIVSIPPSGTVARVGETRERLPKIGVYDVTRSQYGGIENLPDPAADTIYIVSGIVLARTTRDDVFSPGEAVRDDAGRIIGCRGLSASPQNQYLALVALTQRLMAELGKDVESGQHSMSDAAYTAYGRLVDALAGDSTYLPVSPEMLWDMENYATGSYGHGGMLNEDLWKILQKQTGKLACPYLSYPVRDYLERVTPQTMDFEGEFPPYVTIVQKRNILARHLEIKIKVSDGTGDWRDNTVFVKSGQPDAKQRVIEAVQYMMKLVED